MDETAWAFAILCKDGNVEDPGSSLHEYRDDNHNNLDTLHLQQHITDISNSFMEDGGGQYNNSNSSNSNLSINNNNNNNNNNSFNNALSSKEYQRLGTTNELAIRRSPVMDSDEFIDLDQSYNLAMIQQYSHHHHSHHHCNPNLMISSMHHQDQMSDHHQYTNGDHNHYHLHHQNNFLHHRLEYNEVSSAVPHYNAGTDTSSSNSSPVSMNSAQHNQQRHHIMSPYILRKNIHPQPSVIRDSSEYNHHYGTHQSLVSYNNTDQESCSDSESKKHVVIKQEPSSYPARRRPGRPRGSRRKKPEKLGRLWEFIRDLLLNPESCPSLICWDNYEEGMFRFVRSDKVAKLWGEKRDNPEMNYEKLSRAMRYYYKSNVLQPVFGRRLVYKFGPEARGWQTENPNFTC